MENLRRSARALLDTAWRFARVALLLVLVAVGVFAFLGYRARAQVGEHLLLLGMEMMRYSETDRQDAPRRIHMNGQAIYLSTGLTHDPLEQVLDAFETRCLARDGQLFEQFEHVAETQALPVDTEWFKPLIRADGGGAGVVACLAIGEGQVTPQELLERLQRFQESRDLADLGDARYVYAQTTDKGDTHFIGFFTEGSFRLGEVFPEKGDAAGVDPAEVPRPPGLRRLLSAWEEGTKQVVTIYGDGDAPPKLLRQFYREHLPRHGWDILEPHERIPRKAPIEQQILMAEKGERQIGVLVSTDRRGKSSATILTFQ